MGKFIKKPVVTEAEQFLPEYRWRPLKEENDSPEPQRMFMEFPIQYDENANAYIEITTLEGVMRAYADDWIITGVKGEHYPCKPDIFEATYDRT